MSNNLASRVHNAGPLAQPDDGGRAVLTGVTRWLTRSLAGWHRDDIDDAAATAAVVALARMAAGEEPDAAIRGAAHQVALDVRQDAATGRTTAVDTTDPAMIDALDRLAQWSPAAPDTSTRTTDTDLLADTLASVARENAPLARAAARLTRTAALPRALEAALPTLKEHGEATIRRYEHERGGPAMPTAPARDASRATLASSPTSGPASALIVTDPNGQRWVVLDDRASHVTDAEARFILARPTADAYRPTTDDRASDDLAYALTPVGPVRPSQRRRNVRAGGIGSPTITRGPRHQWSDRTARRD